MTVVQLTTDNREPFKQYDNPVPHFGAAPDALLEGFALLPEVSVHIVSCAQRPMCHSPEKVASNIWFHSLHVPKAGWLRTGFQGCIRAIHRRIREINPDIVHGQGTERECALGAIFSGYPNVVTIHGNMRAITKYPQPLIGKVYAQFAALFERIALARTRGVLCNSKYTQQLVAPIARRTWPVPNAVHRAFLETPLNPLPASPAVLLNVGGIVPWKGQLELLALARDLHNRGVHFVLKFVGALNAHTSYGQAFAREIAAAEKDGYAQHLGFHAIGDTVALMDSASALVHVAREEAFGLVVAEALARNLKLFASQVGGVPDIGFGVEGAELFAPNAWPQMGDAIEHWLRAGAPRPKLAADVMRERYDPKRIAERHLEIYREVLAG
jgi:glycosyltransferase involved in cell wall biosynthesis